MTDERLSRKAIAALNRELEPLGMRVCRTCQGAPKLLSPDFFYKNPTCRRGLSHECKRCANARTAAAKARYHASADERRRRYEQQRRYRLRHAAAELALNATRNRTYRKRKKAAAFVRILGKAGEPCASS